MPHSLIHYLSDGQQLDFAVPFAYIKKDYVTAYRSELDSKGRVVGDRVPLAFSWLNAGTLRLDEAVPAGDRITIERETFADTPLVDYQDGTILPEDDLDLSTLQPLHVAQEARDRNAYEILQAAREFAVTAEEVEENADRAEAAATEADDILEQCEEHLVATTAAQADARTSRDRAEAAAGGSEAHAAQAATDRTEVERLAAEVTTNAAVVREDTETTAGNAADVATWLPQIQANKTAAEDAASRAEAAAEAAEQAAGIDTSAFARKDEMELALAEKAPLDSPAFTGTPTAPTPATTDSSTRIATTEFVKGQGYLTDSAPGLIPIGGLLWFSSTTAPDGFLAPSGELLSRSAYPELWAHAQNSGMLVTDAEWLAADGPIGRYSSGNGSTTFRLPMLGGHFLRTWAAGQTVDAGRLAGRRQSDAIRDIIGSLGWSLSLSGASQSGDTSALYWSSSTPTISMATVSGSSLTHPAFRAGRYVPVATENRPVNIAWPCFIRYR